MTLCKSSVDDNFLFVLATILSKLPGIIALDVFLDNTVYNFSDHVLVGEGQMVVTMRAIFFGNNCADLWWKSKYFVMTSPSHKLPVHMSRCCPRSIVASTSTGEQEDVSVWSSKLSRIFNNDVASTVLIVDHVCVRVPAPFASFLPSPIFPKASVACCMCNKGTADSLTVWERRARGALVGTPCYVHWLGLLQTLPCSDRVRRIL